jgi:hypothetical protein
MKKILVIAVLSLLLNGKSFAGPDGKGEITLSKSSINHFIAYLRGGIGTSISTQNKPMVFWVTLDGNYSTFWYCSHGQCQDTRPAEERKICERDGGKECARFAKGRYVKWKNDINPGRGNMSKFNSKWSDTEIIAKLTELGFTSSSASSSKKKTKKQSSDITAQLKSLKELLDDGVLSKEEFDKAKKKLLN